MHAPVAEVLNATPVLESVLEPARILVACIVCEVPLTLRCCPEPSGSPPHHSPWYC
jgi:hypothetical protein